MVVVYQTCPHPKDWKAKEWKRVKVKGKGRVGKVWKDREGRKGKQGEGRGRGEKMVGEGHSIEHRTAPHRIAALLLVVSMFERQIIRSLL